MDDDPGEMNNLVYQNEYKKQLNEHRKMMVQWAEETSDSEFPYQRPE